MYFGGFATEREKIPEVKDIDMLEAKGFDKKFSFRKSKQ